MAEDSIRQEIRRKAAEVRSLQTAVYLGQTNPAADDELLVRLAQSRAELSALEEQVRVKVTFAPEKVSTATTEESAGVPGVRGRIDAGAGVTRRRMLGPETTRLKVDSAVRMQPLPTGVYHLLDPEGPDPKPLLTVRVENLSNDIRRVCIKTHLEGLSAQAVKTAEIPPREKVELSFLPTLLPERAREITEVRRATLHVLIEDLDGKLESHDTYSIVCLARTSSFNAVLDPQTGKHVDFTHYYGAWVTPHAEPIQLLLRKAAESMPDRQVLGYQGDPDGIPAQIEALFLALKEADVRYVNSVIDFGAPPGMATQRTRLPRESLVGRSANCIDGAVLMASLIEAASLNPALVFVPGHAFVAWETWDGSDEWRHLETTMIGSADFAAACRSAERQYEQFMKYSKDQLVCHPLRKLRERGIWPME